MDVRAYAVVMAAYNTWMNEKVYRAAAELTDEERKRDMGAFFRSIHGTLNHILLGDQSWMQRFLGQPVTMEAPDDELYASFEELWAERRRMDIEIAAWAGQIDERSADETFRFYSVTYKKQRAIPRWVAIAHMFNHQAHHRGQVTTLLKQLGRDPGVTDLPWMPAFD